MVKNKVYIIPGLGESTISSNYKQVISILKENGFKVVPIKILWAKNLAMSDYIEEANKQIPENSNNDYILGFSFGAYIASVLSKNKKAKGYIFCSLSPYFKDDLKQIPKESRDYFGKKMIDSFKKYSFPSRSKDSAWFLIGTKDWDLALERAQKSFDKWKGPKELVFVKNAGHSLKDPNYIKAIQKIIKKL